MAVTTVLGVLRNCAILGFNKAHPIRGMSAGDATGYSRANEALSALRVGLPLESSLATSVFTTFVTNEAFGKRCEN